MYKFTFECGCKIINGEVLEYCAKHGAVDALLEAAEAFVNFRDRVGPLNFQLEKADDYFRDLRAAIRRSRGEA